MGDVSVPFGNVNLRGYRRGGIAGDPVDPYIIYAPDRIESFYGRATTFITPGRGATNQTIFAVWNDSPSAVTCEIHTLRVDVINTAGKGVGILGGWIYIHRITAAPTGGTALVKADLENGLTSDANVLVYSDSSADAAGAGTSSGTALAVVGNPTTPLAAVAAPRILATAASGYELVDTAWFEDDPICWLYPGEGVAVSVNYAGTGNVASTGNASTNKWTVFCDWTEYTRP